jgi:hypothetical protein
MERLPTEQALVAPVEAFEAIGFVGETGGRTGEAR